MAPLLEDPRYRQTWNQISQNAETATENAAAGIWTFSHQYITPCFAFVSASFQQCVGSCAGDREERARRQRERERTRGRAEYSFDFYDDWEDDLAGASSGGLLGWGNDELDRLLAGSGSHSHPANNEQPSGRKRGMSYGTRGRGQRRKSAPEVDPTVIPSTNPLGFLQRLPFKIGGTLRYKPSAADLQDRPGVHRDIAVLGEDEPLISDDAAGGSDDGSHVHKTRPRSSTAGSGETTDSFRSRGDLFPSDEEDDAVPIGDEFAMALERRGTIGTDDRSSGKTGSSKGKKPSRARGMSRNISGNTMSSGHLTPPVIRSRGSSASVVAGVPTPDVTESPSLQELQQEEQQAEEEEEAEVERKRLAASQLAMQRGLTSEETSARGERLDKAIVNGGIPPTPSHPDDMSAAKATTDPLESKFSSRSPDSTSEDFVPARLPRF